MRIVYFHQFFSTPKGSWGTRVYEFCKDWAAAGHDVTVVTSTFAKSDLVTTKLVEDQEFEGFKVKVIDLKMNNKESVAKRIRSFVVYAALCSWYAVTLRADVVITSSGPITIGIPALAARWLRRRKLVFEVRDLWPDGAIEMGLLQNRTVQRAAYALEAACYRSADHIVCLSPGMVDNIVGRFGVTEISSITNAADLDLFGTPREAASLPPVFDTHKVAIYTGNIGQVNNSDLLLRAARLLNDRGRDDISIVLVGDGQLKDELVAERDRLGLTNLVFCDLMPKVELVALIQRSFVSLVPLRGQPILDTSSPNKLYESLAAGLPVIQNTKGWIRDLLSDNDCGFTVDPTDETDLADRLEQLADDPDLTARMGANGRALAEREFDQDILSQRYLDVLIGTVGRNR
ncbi:MAG: glycosyltransferase family 4 protein [Acidimicrobiales bacterium]|nr:glycosyltransferase family 4 protein [Acidimicrobiales bacterium]